MKKLLVVMALALWVVAAADAQDYRTGIGFRGGPSFGVTAKHFFTPDQAGEVLLLSRWGGFHVTGLYQFHASGLLVNGLHYYYGAGAHYGSFPGETGRKFYSNPDKNYTVVGLDGILGIEYNFSNFPFNVSLDWKPDINFSGGKMFWPDELALSIRYVWGMR